MLPREQRLRAHVVADVGAPHAVAPRVGQGAMQQVAVEDQRGCRPGSRPVRPRRRRTGSRRTRTRSRSARRRARGRGRSRRGGAIRGSPRGSRSPPSRRRARSRPRTSERSRVGMKYSSWCHAWPGLPSPFVKSIDCIAFTSGPIRPVSTSTMLGKATASAITRRDLVRVVNADVLADRHVVGLVGRRRRETFDGSALASRDTQCLGAQRLHVRCGDRLGKDDEAVSFVGGNERVCARGNMGSHR